jgi:hypothetical protein
MNRFTLSIYICFLFGSAPLWRTLGSPLTQPADATQITTSPLSPAPIGAAGADSSADVNRYGPLGLYDHRSLYGKGVYPEPFIVDDSDGEVNEFRLDWSHQRGKGQNDNIATVELEHGNGLWTLELEVPYEYDTSNVYDPATRLVDHQRAQGFDNINPGARMPVYQWVSADESFDTTFGVAIEVGIPTNSPLSKNTEIVPKVFNDTRIGEHFTAQTILGYSFLRGSDATGGGQQHFEYGMVFGWTIPHSDLPLPDVQDFIPLLELQGATLFNTHDGGDDNLVANLAFRANLFSIGRVQPRLGLGLLLPVDKGAREDFHWGIYTSLVFEF